MALAWGERKRLIRLTGFADELLTATRIPRDEGGIQALHDEIDAVTQEISELLEDSDATLAGEFRRVVVERPQDGRPPDLRAAAVAGWLRAQVYVEELDEKRAALGITEEPPRRKLTIGFRSKSIVAPTPPADT
jgi:hypothetical protein